jgi:hypothetical protein
VLERAAHVATRRPSAGYPGRHRYLYLKFLEGWTLIQGASNDGRSTPAFAFRTTDTQQDWVSPDGSGRQRLEVDGPARFLTPQDRAAWLTSGKPVLAAPSTDGTYPAGGYPAGNQLDPSGLPTEPAELLRAIVRKFEGGRFSVEQTFTTVGTLLQDSGSPSLRGALYRVVEHLPRVQLLGRRSDVVGRKGIAVGVTDAQGVRDELLFDPTTSDVLEEALVQAAPDTSPKPAGITRRLPVGAVLHYFAYLDRGVVDSIETLPGGGRVPLHPGGR